MSRRRDVSLTVAVCLSLVAHGGLVLTLLEGEAQRPVRTGAIERVAAMGPVLVERSEEEKKVEKEKARVEEAVPELAALTPLPPPLLPKVEPVQLKSVFGEPEGRGEAENASAGERELRAKHTAPEDQAFLSKNPEGPGRVADRSAMATAAPGERGSGKPGPMRKRVEAQESAAAVEKASLVAVQQQVAPAVAAGVPEKRREVAEKTEGPLGVPSEREEEVVPRKARKVAEGPAVIAAANPVAPRVSEGSEAARDVKDVEKREGKTAAQAPPPKPVGVKEDVKAEAKPVLVPPVVVASAVARPKVEKQEEGGGGRAGRAEAAADPAPESESEADAFSKVANVEFSNGRVEAQFGRRIKTVKPRLLLSAQYEMFTQENPRVLLSAKVDATGHVTKVEIYQSSGSADLDQPCLVAVYDWWFEPPKDKEGKPMADVVVVGITFRTR